MPQVSPVPDNMSPSNDFNKMLAAAKRIRKDNGDAYMGVDTLLLAVIESSKDVQEALTDSGKSMTPSELLSTECSI